jgi:hypothetical protein
MRSFNQFIYLAITLLFSFSLVACSQGTSENNSDGDKAGEEAKASAGKQVSNEESGKEKSEFSKGKIKFEQTSHDFGKIKEGEKVTHTFNFKNVGNGPLKLSRVKPSCGCTSPDWTKKPVQPGGSGKVDVQFNSSGKPGKQRKSVTVFTEGGKKPEVLRFTAMVQEK